jgi:biopolymer transport protein ExbD
MIISADARTRHQAVVTAMDSAAKVGLTHLSIATTRLRNAP